MADTLKQFALRVFEILYGVYALAVFLVFGLTAFVVVLLPMGVAARRYAAHALASCGFATRVTFPDRGKYPHEPHHSSDDCCVTPRLRRLH